MASKTVLQPWADPGASKSDSESPLHALKSLDSGNSGIAIVNVDPDLSSHYFELGCIKSYNQANPEGTELDLESPDPGIYCANRSNEPNLEDLHLDSVSAKGCDLQPNQTSKNGIEPDSVINPSTQALLTLPLDRRPDLESDDLYLESGCSKGHDSSSDLESNKLSLLSTEKDDVVVIKTNQLHAPDGGYGWVVVFACFIVFFIVGGVNRSAGLLFIQFQSRFEQGAQLTAWPDAISATLNFFLGPAVSALINRFSVRLAVLSGATFYVTGMALNAFSPNIAFLFFSHGLLTGIGMSLLNGPGLLAVNQYFDKKRGIATGLATAGTGFGCFLLLPGIQFLFDYYGYVGTFLLIAAVSGHLIAAAILFRPLPEDELTSQFTRARSKPPQKTKDCTHPELEQLTSSKDTVFFNGTSPRWSKDNDKIQSAPSLVSNSSKDAKRTENLSVQKTKQINNEKKEQTKEEVHQNGDFAQQIDYSVDGQKPENAISPNPNAKPRIFHVELLTNFPFLLHCFAMMFFTLAFRSIFIFLPVIAVFRGLSESEAALVMTVNGALDTFGRIGSGFIMDWPRMRPIRSYVYIAVLFLVGAVSIIVPLLYSFASFTIIGGVYGILLGILVAQTTTVLTDLVGKETLISSFGILKFVKGFGTLAGPTVSGALKDALGDFTYSFYLGGASMMVAGLLMGLSNVMNRRTRPSYS